MLFILSEPSSSLESEASQPVENDDVITLIKKPKNSLHLPSQGEPVAINTDSSSLREASTNDNAGTLIQMDDGDSRIKVYPRQIIGFEGSKTAFSCIVTEGLPLTIDWVLNGKLVKDLGMEHVDMETIHTAGNLVFKQLSMVHNNSYIQCRVLFSNSETYSFSRSVKLLVQGTANTYLLCRCILREIKCK